MKTTEIVLLGAGNVATSLAPALSRVGHVVQVYSRTLRHAQELASTLPGAQPVDNLTLLKADAHVYVLAVSDDAIASLVSAVPDNGAVWLHTSGSTPITVFAGRRARYGVLYPMQSFSKALPVDMAEVPLFVEGSDGATQQLVLRLAQGISHKVTVATSEQRRGLHVAAVFACNYVNHMFTLASEVLEECGLSFDAMLPLIETTVAKLHHLTPAQSQTGPAVRGDHRIMAAHLEMLHGDKQDIYRQLAESIMRRTARRD